MKTESPVCSVATAANPVLQVYLLGSLDFEAALAFQRRLVFDIAGDRSASFGAFIGFGSLQRLQRRCAGRERIVIVTQLVEQIAFYRLTCRSDIDLKNPGGVLTEDLILHLGRQVRVMVLGSQLFGYRERLEASICQSGGPITGVSVPHRM